MTTTRLVLIFAVASCLGVEEGQTQATFDFRNYNAAASINAPVFDSDGSPLASYRYLAVLYGGPTQDSLTPATWSGQPVYSEFLVGPVQGYFQGKEAMVANVPELGEAWLQVRAWDTRLGATYEEVSSLGVGGYGESNLLFLMGGGGAVEPQPLVGLQSFSLHAVVPEPSTCVLASLGAVLVACSLRGGRGQPNNAVEATAATPRR